MTQAFEKYEVWSARAGGKVFDAVEPLMFEFFGIDQAKFNAEKDELFRQI
jgi:hypothetical protein